MSLDTLNSLRGLHPLQSAIYMCSSLVLDKNHEEREYLFGKLQNGDTFDEEAKILHNHLQSKTRELIGYRKAIVYDIEQALAGEYRKCRVHTFGSSLTGLDTNGSDLDIYVENAKRLYETDATCLKRMRTLIFKGKKFSDLLLIAQASVPIIKCIHAKTKICCDISVKNKLSVYNSELIKYYLSFSSKLSTFMILVKYLMESCELKKVNCFSSYSIYMMAIFYLQQKPFCLPSVNELQKNATPVVEDGWNCSFLRLDNQLPKYDALNGTSILNLVVGFLRFYSEFDYFHDVICPYYGRTIRKIDFLHPYDLPIVFRSYSLLPAVKELQPKVVCIQDPFEHNRNVAASVTPQYIGRFTEVCRNTLDQLSKLSNNVLETIIRKAGNGFNQYTIYIKRNESNLKLEEWHGLVKSLSLKILNKVFICKTIQNASINYKNEVLYECEGCVNPFAMRAKYEKYVNREKTQLEIDIDTSDAIPKLTNDIQIKFYCNMKFYDDKIMITMKHMKKNKTVSLIVHYFRLYLPKYITEEEKKMLNVGFVNSITTKDSEEPQTKDTNAELVNAPEIPAEIAPTENIVTKPDNDNTTQEHCEEAIEPQVPTILDCSVEIIEPDPIPIIEITDDETSEREEDVPEDFFDDFANDEFMEGLDIVDTWDNAAKMQKTEVTTPTVPLTEQLTEQVIENDLKPKEPIEDGEINSSAELLLLSKPPTPRIMEDPSEGLFENQNVVVESAATRCDLKKSDSQKSDEILREEVEKKLKMLYEHHKVNKLSADREVKQKHERTRHRSKSKNRQKTSKSPPPREHVAELKKRRRSLSSEKGKSRANEHRRRGSSPRALRKRSRSPDKTAYKPKQQKYEEEKKKRTFLEEITEKMNASRPVAPIVPPNPSPIYNLQSYVVQAPHSVQMPQYYPQTVYDPQCFMGGDSGLYNQNNVIQLHNYMPANTILLPGYTDSYTQHQPGSIISPDSIPHAIEANPSMIDHNHQASIVERNTTSRQKNPNHIDYSNNLQVECEQVKPDNQIPMIDYLSMTTQNQVLLRCQEAINYLQFNQRPSRILVRSDTSYESKPKKTPEINHQSPLRRIQIIRFQFTTPVKQQKPVDTFTLALNQTLHKCGIRQKLKPIKSETSTSIEKTETQTLTVITKKIANEKRVEKCKECEERKEKTHTEIGIQCVEKAKEMQSIGIQVCENELAPIKIPTSLPSKNDIEQIIIDQVIGFLDDKEAKQKALEKAKVEASEKAAAIEKEAKLKEAKTKEARDKEAKESRVEIGKMRKSNEKDAKAKDTSEKDGNEGIKIKETVIQKKATHRNYKPNKFQETRSFNAGIKVRPSLLNHQQGIRQDYNEYGSNGGGWGQGGRRMFNEFSQAPRQPFLPPRRDDEYYMHDHYQQQRPRHYPYERPY